MIRVLRLMEYIYPDNETAEDDMGRWWVPPIGTKRLVASATRPKSIRSTILTDLTFEKEDDDGN